MRNARVLPILGLLFCCLLPPGILPAQNTTPAPPESATTPPAAPELPKQELPKQELPKLDRPVIGVALDGGGALGLAHIGVLQWFEENHIPVDRIAGTSMGSLIGGLYATGHTAAEIAEIATSSDLLDNVFRLEPDYQNLNFRRREDRRELPQAFTVGLRGGIHFRNSFLQARGLNEFLENAFLPYNNVELNYNELPIPFRCVATDLNTFQPFVFEQGPLPLAVRASVSIPAIFPPVQYNGHYYVDGGIVDNLPVDVAFDDLHADKVIAIFLPVAALDKEDVSSIVGVLQRAFSAGVARNEKLSLERASIVVEPDTTRFSGGDYEDARKIIAAGHAAAEKDRAELLPYAISDTAWRAYLAAKQSRRHTGPLLLAAVKVQGPAEGPGPAAARALKPLEGKPIEARRIQAALAPLQSNGRFGALFSTYAVHGGPATSSLGAPATGVLVQVGDSESGPPFLLAGLDLTAQTSNVTRTTFDFRVVNQDLGGYGSELRSDIRVGFLTQASTEYYRRLSARGLFLQPHLGILRQPVYIWANQRRISERLEQRAGGGLDFGRTLTPRLQLAAEWRDQVIRWHARTGTDFLPDLSGSSQMAVVHVTYDGHNSALIAENGFRVDAQAGYLYRSVASQNAPYAALQSSYGLTLREKNIFNVSLNANTYFRRNVAQPLRFELGGPLRLSASSVAEYRATDDYLARAGYLRQISALPRSIGQGLYLSLGYEAGEVWTPEQPVFLREDGVVGLVASTPLGAITLGGSIGDAGRRKVFFTFGRLF